MPNHHLLTLKSLLRRLDYLPPRLAIALGVCLSLGMVLIPASSLVAVMGFGVLLGVAVALAHGGEPIAEIIRESKPESPPPEPVEPPPPERPSLVELVDIPAGVFLMGSTESDREQPIHEVHVPAFRCMRYQVTRRIYKETILYNHRFSHSPAGLPHAFQRPFLPTGCRLQPLPSALSPGAVCLPGGSGQAT